MARQRIAGLGEVRIVRQPHGQLIVGYRYSPARRTLDDGDRTPPVALTRDAPVAQAILRGGLAGLTIHQRPDRGRDRVLRREAIEEVGIVDRAFAGIGLAAHRVGLGVGARRQNDRLEGQAVLFRELDVALVACGRAEDRARTISRQHEVCRPDGQLPAGIERMPDADAKIDPDLVGLLDVDF